MVELKVTSKHNYKERAKNKKIKEKLPVFSEH